MKIKTLILTASIAIAMLAATGCSSEDKQDNSTTVVADSTGNAGSGEGAPTQGAVSGGNSNSSATSDTVSSTKPTQESSPADTEH